MIEIKIERGSPPTDAAMDPGGRPSKLPFIHMTPGDTVLIPRLNFNARHVADALTHAKQKLTGSVWVKQRHFDASKRWIGWRIWRTK